MGGPCNNKAAYVFGTAAITNGNYDIMAAVMIGGMVPPLAIALATTFFPAKIHAGGAENGPVNYIMGLSFITEGAIPYAASDPARVIPACALARGWPEGFQCTLMAPPRRELAAVLLSCGGRFVRDETEGVERIIGLGKGVWQTWYRRM